MCLGRPGERSGCRPQRGEYGDAVRSSAPAPGGRAGAVWAGDRPAGVFDAVLVQGRWSSPVAGSYTPREALGRMLESTGLHPQSAGAGQREAFVILPDPPSSGAAPRGEPSAPPASPGLVFRRYDGLAQTRIRETFCADPRLARGDYRAAVQFGIDPAGRIVEAWLLHTTGDGGRDAAIIAALHGVRLDRPPPAHMEQPITLVIQGESGRAFCPAGR